MASGDSTNLKKYGPVVAMHTAGTTVYLVTKAGELKSYTIAGGATAKVAQLSSGDVGCIVADATYIYIAFHNGQIVRYTIADGTQSELVKFDSAITAMVINTVEQTSLLYISLIDGHLYSYEI